ncbi:MAG TPA: SPOR domain-containing protein, partial [Luteimonas sp.]
TGRAGKPDPRDPALAAETSAAAPPAAGAASAATVPASGSAPASASASASAQASTPGGVLLQVAAFGSRENAERALAQLRGAGIGEARLQDGTSAGKPVWRLRVGPVAPTTVAELSARVAGLGFGAPQPVRE